jgi:uncharacterized cupredoxin-like copper-binding protein
MAAILQPDRTIAIESNDQIRFVPSEIEVTAGETIAFVITNIGVLPHEFVIGDEDVQHEHEDAMTGEHGMEAMDDAANMVDVPPGTIATLIYRFDEAGTTLLGCHVDGHYDAGMTGTITINPAE